MAAILIFSGWLHITLAVFHKDTQEVMFLKRVLVVKEYLMVMAVASLSWERTAPVLMLTFLVCDSVGVKRNHVIPVVVWGCILGEKNVFKCI